MGGWAAILLQFILLSFLTQQTLPHPHGLTGQVSEVRFYHDLPFPPGGRRVRRSVELGGGLSQRFPSRMRMELNLQGNRTTVHLALNKDLIPSTYFERTGDGNVSKPLGSTQELLCHYQGRIEAHPASFAAISTCDDGVRGLIFDGEKAHYLEPLVTAGEGREDGKVVEVFSEALESQSRSRVKRGAAAKELRLPYNSNAKTRYVELVMVVDNRKYRELGSVAKATTRCKDIANIVSALYTPFNIFIALVGVVVWTERDEIVLSSNGDETLNAFLRYRKDRLIQQHPNDNAQLLTGVEFENGVVGKAMQGPMCSYKYSGGVNSDFQNNMVGIVATTVAHEMGHNFGLSHDREDCSCPSGRCIMAASASSNRTFDWSSCSVKDMAYAFDHGMDYCLRNPPKALYQGSVCGNGFTEPGEECDCGLPGHCDNPCCDPSTCLMHSNATCASGTCCDMLTCHVKEPGTPCRESVGLCDLPEYCTGESEFCPEDVTMLDGLPCQTPHGKAYCSKGHCSTRTDQCRLLWGPSGNNSDNLCYQRNTNGSRVAHCGYDLVTEKYTACGANDYQCGVLHCEMNNEKLEYGYESAAILASFFVNARNKIHACRSVVVDFGLADTSPGMVPDGAPCGEGDGRMCVGQKCQEVPPIPPSCQDCSGRGKCNSKGNCHCDDGYGGKFCEGPGLGGSPDSGPALYRGTSKILKALKVTIFGFIPLIGIITFYLYYGNGSLKRICLEIRTNGLAAVANPPLSGRSGPPPKPPPPSKSPSQGQGSGSSSAPRSPAGEDGRDFYGNFRGFSLAPIKKAEGGTPNGLNHNHNQNNVNNNGVIKCLPPTLNIATAVVQEATLVGNSDKGQLGLGQGASKSGASTPQARGVSWAQPIEHRLSPEEEDSAGSDTPLYENSGAAGGQSQKGQPSSNSSSSPKTPPKLRKEPSFSGLTSRLASSLASVLQLRRSNSSLEKGDLEKGRRKAVEISHPILVSNSPQQPNGAKKGSPTPIRPHNPTYANIPLVDESPEETPLKEPFNKPLPAVPTKPALKTVQRMRSEEDPTPKLKAQGNGKKVQRAHSMIASTLDGKGDKSNRNSVGNYNSLRRPTAPPPKPPVQTKPAPFFKSSTPPPYNPVTMQKFGNKSPTPEWLKPRTNSNSSEDSAYGSGSGSSGLTNPGKPGSTNSLPTNSSLTTTSSYVSPFGRSGYRSIFNQYPLKKNLVGGSKEPSVSPKEKEDNIYDTIDEGISTPPAASSESEDSSPVKAELSEKIETLSTGSSDGGTNGLLGEIISEIKTRNRESIYNSIDRRKQKRERERERAERANNELQLRTGSPKIGENKKMENPQLSSMQMQNGNSVSAYRKPSSPLLTGAGSVNNYSRASSQSPPRVPAKPMCAVSGFPKQPSASDLLLTSTNKPTEDASKFNPNSRLPDPPPPERPVVSATKPAWSRSTPPPKPVISQGQGQGAQGPRPSPNSNIPPSLPASYITKIPSNSHISPGNKKPLASLPAPSSQDPKEIVYAPSSILSSGSDDKTQNSHLSTIRRSKGRNSSSIKNLALEVEAEPLTGETETAKPASEQVFIKKPGGGGIYASLGRKVSTPVIRSNSIEREKKRNGNEESFLTSDLPSSYSSHSPMMNKPVTFSTFRKSGSNLNGN